MFNDIIVGALHEAVREFVEKSTTEPDILATIKTDCRCEKCFDRNITLANAYIRRRPKFRNYNRSLN